MAIEKFWFNVRGASSLMIPRAPVDSPRLNRKRIERALRSDTSWLTPGTIKKYDPKEFDFLNEAERTQLDEGVREFQAVVESIPKNTPATVEQVDQGVAAFRKIIEVMRPDKYSDCDALILGKKLEAQLGDELPDWVRELVFESGNNHMGEPSVWVWVEVEDFAAGDGVFAENARLVREIVRTAGEEVCPDRLIFFHFRTASEQKPSAQARRQRE